MTLEELNYKIRAEYVLFRHFEYLYDFGNLTVKKLKKNLENILENTRI